ncbi:diaminopimelate dehydrogenase [Pseudopedobacter saltans DSM 12145]|uniref:Meso-diaminopimelate D-dehydrogenase n=1 Tax=Pseudopedobacter saltans (strain ATCC 51119 / DSM 12145 / JCM 21818 / CCUG 39354 / LMG 10337 / NBRC 100064 / NCIMB 13643) TaxID=762903 RepID=F0SDS3_PSESL|nr:diaminopimelate dehydrogenase [Pseudopedobacter saltans]ADY51819.1 diaminopimelate dehydrogenase [Pseudopedobacter saltans DSM 12145]
MRDTFGSILRVGIVGYGNLGKGVELAIKQNPDMELVAVFTRRQPSDIGSEAQVVSITEMENFKDKIDVMVLCGGSSQDLPEQVLEVSKLFNTVDSFDTHAKIPEYFAKVDENTKAHNTLSLISTGWDPGLFSLARLIGQSVLPEGEDYTFWGKGLSQGHSDAVRRVAGVKGGVQYTIPIDNALERVRSGENPELTTAEKHQRVCYIVPEEGADLSEIETAIKTMPHYFADYETIVNFISEEELKAEHSTMPHGGIVFRSGKTGNGTKQRIEFSLALESNPEFTASVLVAYTRAVGKMAKQGQTGARTVLDVPLAYLSSKSDEELRRTLL